MARSVAYPEFIEPLVHFVEDTAPEHIVARTHDKLAAGTPVKEMLLASALAVVRSSDLPPGHHGGPLHPLAGLHAVHHIAARLPGEYARLPVIQNVAVANKHIHSPAMGPYILADANPGPGRCSGGAHGEAAGGRALAAEDCGRSRCGGIPEMLARALADGLSLEGGGGGLAVGGSTLCLRSRTGNAMAVDTDAGVNSRRYLPRQTEVSVA